MNDYTAANSSQLSKVPGVFLMDQSADMFNQQVTNNNYYA